MNDTTQRAPRRTTEYWSWAMMKQRCSNSKYTHYKYYGGKGVTFCEEWKSYDTFYRDMGPKPTKHHTLDRIDSDGNYSPENCRWADKRTQALNRGKNSNNTSGYKGVSRMRNGWRAYATDNYKQVQLGHFSSIEEAVAARKSYELQNKW